MPSIKRNQPSSSSSTSTFRPSQKRECACCYETFILNNDSNTISTPCVNPDCQQNVCSNCIFHDIDSKIKNNCSNISCRACHQDLDTSNVSNFLKVHSTEAAERYELIVLNNFLENQEGFVWCAHGCGGGAEMTDNAQIMTCVTCRKKTCVVCKTKWHEGITCQEWNNHELTNKLQDMNLLNDFESEKYIQQITKECPKCKFRFEKEEKDCDHVKCVKCHLEFCWSCGADYKQIIHNDNSFHDSSCRFHSSNINQ